MLIFAVDTCSMSSTAAIADEVRTLAQFTVNHKKTHSEKIMPQIDAMIKAADISLEDIDVFAVATGPGSFTGVRIGVATVKGFALALNKPCVSVSAIEALSYSVASFKGIIAPILDARRNQVYNGLFESDGREIKRLCPDRALKLSELLEELKSIGQDVIFVGDGTPVFKDEIEEALKEKAYFAKKPFVYNLAPCVAEIGLSKFKAGEIIKAEELVPEYVRLSQAEQEKLKSKEGENK